MSARRCNIAAIALVLACFCASPASAATCEVNPQGVTFGTYDPLAILPHDGVGNINVRCDLLTGFTIELSSGNGTVENRRMHAGASQLRYNLFKGPARLAVWGDGGSGGVSAIGTNVNLPVYGRIPARQNVEARVYIDSITVTIIY